MPSQCWKHFPGKNNPADIPSRGLSPAGLSISELWRSGPEWLRFGTECQPLMCCDDIPDQCMTELKARSRPVLPHALLTQQTAGIALVIDCERFSNSHKLYRVTALVLKFIQLLKKQATSPELEGQPVPAPEQPPLPKFRVRESPPFTHTAVDFASPLYVKVRKQVKCGFVCSLVVCPVRCTWKLCLTLVLLLF